MFQQTISEKIKNMNLLQKEDLYLFNELKNKYPFAEIFQLMHLQLIKKYDSFSFEEELNFIAYKIRDRNKLSELLEENIETIVEEEENLKNSIELENDQNIENDQNNKPIEEIIEEDIIKINDTPPSEIEKEIDDETSSLNIQIAAEAFSTIFSKNFEPTIQNKIEDDLNEENIEELKQKNDQEIKLKEIDKSHKSFTSWLKSNKKDNKTDKNQIIETIIATNPTISRPKKEFYNPNKQAIKSVDDEKLVYTETLAKILEMQGNFSKAISAYTQLSLTIPEKKTYFAKKIEDLNEKLNSK